jgi:hypothetical protein
MPYSAPLKQSLPASSGEVIHRPSVLSKAGGQPKNFKH